MPQNSGVFTVFRGSKLARSNTIIPREAPTKGRRVEPLIEIERKILDFMVQYLRANTYQPSIREIGERFGIKSTKTVSEHLQALADKGFLERDPSRSRGVKILGVDLSAETVSVPCYGEVPNAHGARVAADMHLSVDRRMGGERGCFIVRADGRDLAVLERSGGRLRSRVAGDGGRSRERRHRRRACGQRLAVPSIQQEREGRLPAVVEPRR